MGVNEVRKSFTASVLLVAAALLGAGAPAAAQAPVPPNTDPTLRIIERILVKVNGEIITQSDLEERQVAAIRARGVQPSTNAELMQLVQEVTPSVLAAAVEELLLVERGRELGYQLSDDQFQDYLDTLKEDNGIESDEQFIQMLEQQEGMTLDDFRRLVERQMLAGQVQQVQVLGPGNHHRRRSARVLRFAHRGIHRAGPRHAAGDHRCRAGGSRGQPAGRQTRASGRPRRYGSAC